jgi:signal transduction histidine kinase
MLADGMVRDDDSRRSYLDTLKGESRRLARIVENVLDFARLGQGKARANGSGEPVAAAALVDRMLPVLRRRAEQAGMVLAVDAAGLDGLAICADPQSVERIVYNLVDNACKYAGEALDRRVHVIARRIDPSGRGPALEIEVRDHGPGIPRPDRRRLFAAFHRARRDEQSAKSGLGLGLALSRGLARELGGTLTLADEPGDGAVLRLVLPSALPPTLAKPGA